MPQNALQTNVALSAANLPAPLRLDANGALQTSSPGSAGNSSKNYVANTAGNQIKTGAGVVVGINVNTAGLTSAIVLYDGTSTAGTKLGTFSTLAQAVLALGNMAFTTGLFAVLTGGTPADVTVVYR